MSSKVAIEAERQRRAQEEEPEALRELRSVRDLNKITKTMRRLLDGCKFCQIL